MIRGYLESAWQRLMAAGGFRPVEPDLLSETLSRWAGAVLAREEPGLTTLVAIGPAADDPSARAVRDELAALARQMVQGRQTEALVLMVVAAPEPITTEQYGWLTDLKLHLGAVRLVAWAADLVRGRLFLHSGPPFGTPPDLAALVAPAPPPAPAPGRRREIPAPRPWVTLGLLGLIAAVWVAMLIAAGGSPEATDEPELLIAWGAAVRPELWTDGEYWRLFTANFVHIGPIHLTLNALSLWSVGRPVEMLYGPRRALFIFLTAGVAGATTSAVLGVPSALSAGASGAIFGLLGAVIWFRLASPLGAQIAWMPLLVTLALNLGLGVALYHMIDNWNHLGGLAGGFLAAIAVQVPVISGLPRPRLYLGKPFHVLAAGLLVVLAVAVVAGLVPLPGPGRDLARAYELERAGRLAEAEAGLLRAVRRQPEDPYLRLRLAIIYLHERKCAEAEAELARVLEAAPGEPEIRALYETARRCRGAAPSR